MSTVVLLGGNGYIGRNVTEKWLEADPEAEFLVVSRSGRNILSDPRITNAKADCSNYGALSALVPEKVDYIVDFIGGPRKDPTEFKKINELPAEVMLRIAKEKQVKAMGIVGAGLGSKSFLEGKRRINNMLLSSRIRTEVVNPTLVYGKGRKDAMVRIVFLLKVLGVFVKKLRPVHVDVVAGEMVEKMLRK